MGQIKEIDYSDGTHEACYLNNLAWFLVIGLMFLEVTSRMFFQAMQSLNSSVFADVDAYANTDANLDFDADATDAYADFELIFLKVISVLLNFYILGKKGLEVMIVSLGMPIFMPLKLQSLNTANMKGK